MPFKPRFFLSVIQHLSVNHSRISRRYIKHCVKCLSTRKPNSGLMKLENNSEFYSCITEEVTVLKNLFEHNGYEIRIVGGAVRDLLRGIKPEDLDFATTATPEEMKKIFTGNNIRMINMNGEKHGTITARINDKNFEVTTLRIDEVTDGRRAKVQFTRDWVLDANRRDLTINAMYLDFQGNLYDYHDGHTDLKNNIVRFVGDSKSRIQEDYLRILRYFRFFGKIAQNPNQHLEEVISAIQENAKGLEGVSGERIWIELNKIATGNFALEILMKMIELGVGRHIGFPENCNEIELKKVCDKLKKFESSVKAMTLLTALFSTEEDLNNFFLRIKPSGFDRDLGHFIILYRHSIESEPKPIRFFQKYILNSKQQANASQYVNELLKYKGQIELLKELNSWKVPKFPIGGNILKDKGVTGKKIGIVVESLKAIWIDKGFNISTNELLEYLPSVMANMSEREQKRRKSQ